MSAIATNTSATSETACPISESEDMKMFQAARRAGRRNALADLGEQLTQGDKSTSTSCRTTIHRLFSLLHF
jgi:hypothetical protein